VAYFKKLVHKNNGILEINKDFSQLNHRSFCFKPATIEQKEKTHIKTKCGLKMDACCP